MNFLDYETCDKLMWTSGEGLINTNTINKQGNPKWNINRTFPSLTLGFGCYPHKGTCYKISKRFCFMKIASTLIKKTRGKY